MSKIIIYNNRNILIANLNGEVKSNQEKINECVTKNNYTAHFSEFKMIHSISLRKQLKKIEKIFKYHKEKEKG